MISFGTWLVVALVGGALVMWTTKQNRGCGVLLGILVGVALVVMALASMTFTTSGTLNVRPASTPTVRGSVRAPAPAASATPHPLLLYAGEMQKQIGRLADALRVMEGLTKNADVDSEQWRAAVAVQLGAMRNAHAALLAVGAPDGWQEVHSLTVSATGHCNDATFLFAAGIDERSVALLNQSAAKIAECMKAINVASEAVDQRVREMQ